MLLVRFFQAVFLLSLLGIVLVLCQAGATSAGRVIFSHDYRAPGSNQAVSFDKPAILKVFQSKLQPGKPDYYTFQGNKDDFLKVKLDTLRLVGQDNFQPSLALFGPGLPQPSPEEVTLFPYSLPAGNGILISAESGQAFPGTQVQPPNRFDEPWTQSGYWERQSIVNQLPESGTYFLVVYSLNNQAGKYALFVGDKPEVSLRETLTFPVTWARLHYWFDDLWWPSFAMTLAGLAAAFLAYVYGRLVWRQYLATSRAARNERRSALLKKKARQSWQQRRINRKPARKVPSSNTLSKKGFPAQTARRIDGTIAPAAPANANLELSGQELPNSLDTVSPAASFKWEGTGSPNPLRENEAGRTNTNRAAQDGNSSPGSVKMTSSEDGLAEWSHRFRP